MKFRGILLDINDNYVTLFDCETSREIRLRNTYQNVANRDNIAIGNVYQFRNEKILRNKKNDMERLVEVKVSNGNVFLKTFALTPSANVEESPYSTAPVSDKVHYRYKGCVYSPQLGMLEDPDNVVRNIRGYNEGEYARVCVEYYPGNEVAFRVVKGYSRTEYFGPERVSPWHQDENGDDVYHERAMEIKRVLGCWYQHVVNDHRKHKSSMKRYRNRPTFVSVTASQLQRIVSPIRVRDDEQEVEIPVSFRFDRQMFEKEEDRFLPRDERRVKADAHFWNETIGKVDIPQDVALQIVQNADHIRHQTQRRTIFVKVYVKLVDNYIERAQMVKKPMVAFFGVERVRGFYNKKNRLIQNVLNFN